MVRFGELGQLKPEKIEEYCALHANPWPEVLKTITDCNLRNYSIFLQGDKVFAYFEYVGEDYEADMEKMAADPVTQDWWKCTHLRQTRTEHCTWQQNYFGSKSRYWLPFYMLDNW